MKTVGKFYTLIFREYIANETKKVSFSKIVLYMIST